MTLSIVPVDAAGIDNIAEGLSGFVDETQELQQSMMTTLFISGASDASGGSSAYLLLEDGSRSEFRIPSAAGLSTFPSRPSNTKALTQLRNS